jgi:hypothetical protein
VLAERLETAAEGAAHSHILKSCGLAPAEAGFAPSHLGKVGAAHGTDEVAAPEVTGTRLEVVQWMVWEAAVEVCPG